MDLKALTFLILLTVTSSAAPTAPTIELASSIATRQSSGLPLLNLDYGTYRASIYNADADIYTFTNIRYAAPPTGSLRWKKPQPPTNMSDIQDGSVGFACMQPSNTTSTQSEDCLFLDVYVPGNAIRGSAQNLPVVVWIHGGKNTNGAKDLSNGLFYNGTGPMSNANSSFIFVAANYRLGPWGWLSGDTMEKQGLPNAGLHDQRAVFKWVQNYISLLGGDKTQVTAWGESAGASDLFHHLIAQGGTLDPLFSKAMLQSPASMTMTDRKGMQEDCFQAFAAFASCAGAGVDCLRSTSSDLLKNASVSLSNTANGTNCVNVASDGTYVRQPATLEYASGSYWKGLQSIIISHVANEAAMFLPAGLKTNNDFNNYISGFYPGYAINASVVDAILKFYPVPSASGLYQTENARALDWIRDAAFSTRVRSLSLAYANKSWNIQYSVPPAYHAADLIPLFWNQYVNASSVTGVLGIPIPSNIGPLSSTYQSYMTSHAISGDPNTFANLNSAAFPAVPWTRPGNLTSEQMTNVLNFGAQGVSLTSDNQVLKSRADFQQQVVAAVTNLGGYAVPGTVTSSGNVGKTKLKGAAATKSASRNYVDQCVECKER